MHTIIQVYWGSLGSGRGRPGRRGDRGRRHHGCQCRGGPLCVLVE